MDTSDTASSWSLYSDCDCYLCQYGLNCQNMELKPYPFQTEACQPWVYYAQCRHGRKRDCKECRKPNCFVRAFRWYTNEHGAPCQNPCKVTTPGKSCHTITPCKERCRDVCTERREPCSDQPKLSEFASWLDSKYQEFLAENSECRDTCGRKRYSRGQNYNRAQRCQDKECPKNMQKQGKNQGDASMEFIMTPKNMSRAVSESCHPSPNSSDDRHITKSRSATTTVCIHKSVDYQEFDNPPVEQKHDGSKRSKGQKNVFCQCDTNTRKNIQTQYELSSCSPSCPITPRCPSPSEKQQVNTGTGSREITVSQANTSTGIQEITKSQTNIAMQHKKTGNKSKVICKCPRKSVEKDQIQFAEPCPNLNQPCPSLNKPATSLPYHCPSVKELCPALRPCPSLHKPCPPCDKPNLHVTSTGQYEQVTQSRPGSQIPSQYNEPRSDIQKPCPVFQKPCPSLVTPTTQLTEPCPSVHEPCPGRRPCPTLREPCPPCPKWNTQINNQREEIPPSRLGSQNQYQQPGSFQSEQSTVDLKKQSNLRDCCVQREQGPSFVDPLGSQNQYQQPSPVQIKQMQYTEIKSNLRDCCMQREQSRFVEPLQRGHEAPKDEVSLKSCAVSSREQYSAPGTGILREASTGVDRCANTVCPGPCKNCLSMIQGVRQTYPNRREDCHCPNSACLSGTTYDSTKICKRNETVSLLAPNVLITTTPLEGMCSINCPYYASMNSNMRAQINQTVQFSQNSRDGITQTSNTAIQLNRNTVPEYALFMKVVCADKLNNEDPVSKK